MLCEHYKDALIEAAASGAAPQGILRAHVDSCASCRATFAEEQSLFAAIDSELHADINAEVPPSLIPQVRAHLEEATAPRLRWAQPLVFASAGVVLVLLVLMMARPHRTTPENVAKQEPVVAPAPARTEPNANPGKISPADTQSATVRVGHPRASRNSTIPHSVASSNPEVLVPPDEREGLTRLVAALNEHRNFAAALLARRPEKKDDLVTVDPLQIADIEIKPLAGTETETPDGAGEKH